MSIATPTAGPPVTVPDDYAGDPWLRLIWLRGLQSARQGLHAVKVVLTKIATSARDLATTGLTLLTTRAGYDATVRIINTGIRVVTRVVGAVVRFAARPVRWLGTTLLSLIRRVSPTAADTVQSAVQAVVRPVRAAVSWVAQTVTGAGRLLEGLAHTDEVANTTTTAAKATGGVLLVNALTNGAAAAQVTSLLPGAAGLITALVNPWVALGLVAAAFAISAGTTLASAMRETPEPVQALVEADTSEAESEVSEEGRDETFTAQETAAALRVDISTDGTVTVDGLPDALPESLRDQLADVATQAAQTELHRSMGTRPRPNASDRKKAGRAARHAVMAHLEQVAEPMADAA